MKIQISEFLATVLALFIMACWIGGIVIASGFWSTLFSIIMPVYSWYLLAERLMSIYGFI